MRQVTVYRIHCPACAFVGNALSEQSAYACLWDHAGYAHESDLQLPEPEAHTIVDAETESRG